MVGRRCAADRVFATLFTALRLGYVLGVLAALAGIGGMVRPAAAGE